MPLALLGMVAILGITFFVLNAGRLIVQRERTRMLTDITVMSGATVYARCLNFDAALKKIKDVTGFLNTVLGWFPAGGEALIAADNIVKEAKEGFEGSAPYLTAGCMEFVAFANGVPALPLWNVKDIFDPQAAAQGATPSLNFKNNEGNSNNPNSSASSGENSDHYSYRHHSSGEAVTVDSSQVKDDASGGAQGRSRDQDTGRFVKHDKAQTAKAEGEHSLTLITYDILESDDAGDAMLKKLPHFYGVARARISGGNFDFSSTKSLEWGCFLAPVTVKDESVELNLPEIPMSGFSSIDSFSKKANLVSREAEQWASRVPAILH